MPSFSYSVSHFVPVDSMDFSVAHTASAKELDVRFITHQREGPGPAQGFLLFPYNHLL